MSTTLSSYVVLFSPHAAFKDTVNKEVEVEQQNISHRITFWLKRNVSSTYLFGHQVRPGATKNHVYDVRRTR